jgi:hypothetical protein
MRFSQPVIYQTSYKGKKYIGQHIGTGRDYVGGGRIIKDIIKSGNRHKLKTKVIEYVNNVNLLTEREIYWIKKIKPELNLAPGGEGGDRSMFFTKEILKSKSEKMKAVVRDKKWCNNISKSKLGCTHSKEAKEKMSIAKRGIKPVKAIKASLPIRKTDEYRKKMSESIKKMWLKRKAS